MQGVLFTVHYKTGQISLTSGRGHRRIHGAVRTDIGVSCGRVEVEADVTVSSSSADSDKAAARSVTRNPSPSSVRFTLELSINQRRSTSVDDLKADSLESRCTAQRAGVSNARTVGLRYVRMQNVSLVASKKYGPRRMASSVGRRRHCTSVELHRYIVLRPFADRISSLLNIRYRGSPGLTGGVQYG
jgi:hypothetical protein